YPRTRRAPTIADSDEDWLQAGEVFDQFESDKCFAASWVLGRSGLLGILRLVAERDFIGAKMASHAVEIENAKTGEVTEAVYEHPFIVRLCHWVNAVALFVLAGSGLQIF